MEVDGSDESVNKKLLGLMSSGRRNRSVQHSTMTAVSRMCGTREWTAVRSTVGVGCGKVRRVHFRTGGHRDAQIKGLAGDFEERAVADAAGDGAINPEEE